MNIERRAGLKFERVGAPQPSEMARIAAERAVDAIEEMDKSVLPYFHDAAKRLLTDLQAKRGMSDVDVVALALAKITGHTRGLKRRSLMTASDDHTTLQFRSPWTLDKPGQVTRTHTQ